MLYRCRHCHHEENRGCLPAVASGAYYSAIFIVSFLLFPMFGFAPIGQEFHEFLYGVFRYGSANVWIEFGSYVILRFLAACLVAVVLDFTLRLLEFLAFALRKCPKCDARSWSWGYTSGRGQ
jgi:hypothetical protein